MIDVDGVLAALDEIEGYRPGSPTRASTRAFETTVTFDDGRVETAWAPTSTTRRSAAPRGSSPATISNISR